MKKWVGFLSGAIVAGQQVTALAEPQVVAVDGLQRLGISRDSVLQSFKSQAGVDLQSSDKLKVTADEEGKNLKFETFDHLSAVVDIQYAMGVGNKDYQQL